MTPATLIEANRHRNAAPAISHWSFDRLVGRISARDQWGNLVMAIEADPQFGQRLAAAFDGTPPDGGVRFVERRQHPAVRQPLPAAVSLGSLADHWRTAAVAA
jgi:hypothetical protein